MVSEFDDAHRAEATPPRDNNNSLYLNTVKKTDGSSTADVAVYYNTKQYSTIQYLILKNYGVTILKINLY